MTEEIEPFERPGIRPGAYYEVKKFYRTKILTLTEASEYSGIASCELIELGASGKVTLCIRIPKAIVMLWTASRKYLSIREPSQHPEFVRTFSLFERINRTHQLCPDREKTEWVNLSPEDCIIIKSVGIHRQAYFESGWRLTDHLLFESTYPKYSFENKEDNSLNYISPISLIFISYRKDNAKFVDNNYRHKPDEIYEIEIKKEELMIPKEELQYLMKMVSEQKTDADGDSVGCNADLDSENDDVKGDIDNCLLVSNANQSDTGSTYKSTLQISTNKPNNRLWDQPYASFYEMHNREPKAKELLGLVEKMANDGDLVFKYRKIDGKSVLSYSYANGEKIMPVKLKNVQNAIDARRKKAKQSTKQQGINP